ncbi:MAG: signal peptidase II [Gammaproteobacteria bacterium]|jgi:signal peptidase II|nr:lipoprotein signal peptidase [Gammaproteobacteria bacterium]
MSSTHPQMKWLWISLLVVVLDQATKLIAESLLTPHQAVNLLPFFDWYLTYNTGAAFSFLANAGGWQRWLFTAIAIVISVVIVQWIRKLPPEETMTAFSLSLILGGAIGNLIDRVYLGHVIDYIQVWLGNYPWPAFNIADAAISVGAALLILSSFAGIGNTSTE